MSPCLLRTMFIVKIFELFKSHFSQQGETCMILGLLDVLWRSIILCIKISLLNILEFYSEMSVGKGSRGLLFIPQQIWARFGWRSGIPAAGSAVPLWPGLPSCWISLHLFLENFFLQQHERRKKKTDYFLNKCSSINVILLSSFNMMYLLMPYSSSLLGHPLKAFFLKSQFSV